MGNEIWETDSRQEKEEVINGYQELADRHADKANEAARRGDQKAAEQHRQQSSKFRAEAARILKEIMK